MKEPRYSVSLTRRQAQEILLAVEVLARLRIGQIDLALDQMIGEEGFSHNIPRETVEEVEELIKPHLGLSKNQYWGVGRFEEADVVFDIYEVLRHRLSWDTAVNQMRVSETQAEQNIRGEGMWGVSYDLPMHWTKSVPLIQIKKEESEVEL